VAQRESADSASAVKGGDLGEWTSLEHLGADRTDPAALDTVARALKLRIGRTAPVQQGSKAQVGNLVVPDAGVWAFQAKPGATSPVIETSVAYYLFRLDSLHEAGVPPLSEIRSGVEQAVRDDKKWSAARQLAKAFLKRVEEGSTMSQAAAAMKLPHREFGPFSRINPPLTNPVVVGAAFGLKKGQRSGILDTKDGIYVIESLERVKADSAKFVKELDEYRARSINAAKQERVRNFLAALRKSAKIVDNRDKVLQQQPGTPTPAPPVI
jgi:hypothetical protein